MPTIAPSRLDHPPAELARRLARDEARWLPQVRFDAGERVAVQLAIPADGCEAWLLTWLPGQRTGLHDHGGAGGAFAVLRGSLDETTLAPAGPGGFRPTKARLSAPAVRAFGHHHVHDVLNAGVVPAVSLHVYAPALTTMTRYRLQADGRLDVLARERAGRDW